VTKERTGDECARALLREQLREEEFGHRSQIQG
jgi:hypothetical protein